MAFAQVRNSCQSRNLLTVARGAQRPVDLWTGRLTRCANRPSEQRFTAGDSVAVYGADPQDIPYLLYADAGAAMDWLIRARARAGRGRRCVGNLDPREPRAQLYGR
jgi:hypothetical protein